MSYFTGTIHSKALHMDTTIGVILPHDSRMHRGIAENRRGVALSDLPKTLILLHGLSDNWCAWAHRTPILRYAEEFDIAVLIPEVQRSFYQDMVNGPSYFQYLTEELPELAAQMFQLSVQPEDLMVAGLSMGGYGALKCGFTYPERFMGIGAFSSACDLKTFVQDEDFAARKEIAGWARDRKGVFGENLALTDKSDLFSLIDTAAACNKKPRVFMTCGTEDYLYDMNVALRDYIRKYPFDFTYEEWPGIHEWGFWDKSILLMLEHFLLAKK